MYRQIILDTETTGLRVEEGHRLIEIGCLEMLDRKLTGKHFHYYLNPERDVEAGAQAVHGITSEFLQDKPTFMSIACDFIAFITGAELIIHNAPFDLGFLNNELKLAGESFKPMNDYCSVIDTLQLARRLHAGQRNNLDALCKRYRIDNTKRDLHGALLDADLLSKVYLAMTGGQGSFFDENYQDSKEAQTIAREALSTNKQQKYEIPVIKADASEISLHEEYLLKLKKNGSGV